MPVRAVMSKGGRVGRCCKARNCPDGGICWLSSVLCWSLLQRCPSIPLDLGVQTVETARSWSTDAGTWDGESVHTRSLSILLPAMQTSGSLYQVLRRLPVGRTDMAPYCRYHLHLQIFHEKSLTLLGSPHAAVAHTLFDTASRRVACSAYVRAQTHRRTRNSIEGFRVA